MQRLLRLQQRDAERVAEYATRFVDVYRQASRKTRKAGREWYPVAHSQCLAIAKELGYDTKRVCFAAAALSNNIDWEQNVALTYNVALCVKNGVPATGHFGYLLEKATRILRDGDFGALSGPKVVPFAWAIWRKRSNAAVVDRWIWRICDPDTRWLTAKRLRLAQIALRRTARQLRVPVSDLQAIVWLAVRSGEVEPLPF